jgi:asparagine synthase (glutamine-hydrolysing)
MCGIAGYNFTGIDKNYFKDNIQLVLNILKNRGPDHQDFWENDQKNCFLLNTRLKIQDLHDRANMPMVSGCKNFVISYNGELYNKDLLKKKYLRDIELTTNSDTEIILNLYINYGKNFLNFLDGMFAISIYNLKERSLFLARDPLGIKPLYYTHEQNYLFFSSSIKSFYFKRKINNEALIDFFSFGFVIEPKTILDNVKSLEPGNFLLYKNNMLIKNKYFNLKEIFNDHNNDIETEIEKSVVKHYTNDVPSCLFLSSGTDSNIILSLLKKNKIDVPTISINFENSKYEKNISNERNIIKKICSEQKIENYHKFISKYELEEYNSLFYKEMDQPTTDGLNTFVISKIANQMNYKVAYSGLGGDELFCDYGTVNKIKLVHCVNILIKIFGLKEILKLLIKKINFKNPKYKNIFDYNETSQIYFFTRSLFTSGEKFEVLKKLITINSFEKYKLPFNDLYLNTSFLEYNIYLKNQLLRDSDWASMANSIELRLPFVNKELISNAFQVKQKITRKDILKKIDKNIYRHVSKKKIGFYAPTYKKTAYHNPLKERSFTIIKKFIEINDLKN